MHMNTGPVVSLLVHLDSCATNWKVLNRLVDDGDAMVCQKVRWSAADDIIPGAVLKIRESAVRGSLHDKSPHSPPASTVLRGKRCYIWPNYTVIPSTSVTRLMRLSGCFLTKLLWRTPPEGVYARNGRPRGIRTIDMRQHWEYMIGAVCHKNGVMPEQLFCYVCVSHPFKFLEEGFWVKLS